MTDSIKYIALSPIKSHWGQQDETIFLSDSCCEYEKKELWRKYHKPINPCKLGNALEYTAALNYCNILTQKIICNIACVLEDKYNLGYDARFYERVFSIWLHSFIGALYIRYTNIVSAHKAYPYATFISAPYSAKFFPLPDGMTSSEFFASDALYNLYIDTDILANLNYPREERVAPPLELPTRLSSSPTPERRGNKIARVILPLFSILTGFFGKPIHYLHGCGVDTPLDILKKGRGRWCDISTLDAVLPLCIIDTDFRSTPLQLGKSAFEQLLSVMVMRHMPSGMCELLPALVKWAEKRTLRNAGVIATRYGGYHDLPLLVLASVKGVPLVIIEHGGTAIAGENDPSVVCQSMSADRYFGYADENHKLPTTLFSSKAKREHFDAPVLVCSNVHRFPCRIPYDFRTDPLRYHEERKVFLRSIPCHMRPTVRPYFSDCGWGMEDELKDEFPALRFQDPQKNPMSQVLANASLIIVDHQGTTIPRALVTETPLIIWSSRKYSAPCSMNIWDELAAAGIWHDTPESAAAFYLQLIPTNISSWQEANESIENWWHSPPVKAACHFFRKYGVSTSPTWVSDWTRAFDALATSGPRKDLWTRA